MTAVKIEILEKYKNKSTYEVIDLFENEYKNVKLYNLINLRKLITKIRELKDANIYQIPIDELLNKHPFFILKRTSVNQYLLFLNILTGDKSFY